MTDLKCDYISKDEKLKNTGTGNATQCTQTVSYFLSEYTPESNVLIFPQASVTSNRTFFRLVTVFHLVTFLVSCCSVLYSPSSSSVKVSAELHMFHAAL